MIFFSLKIDNNRTNDKITANEKLKKGKKGIFNTTGSPKLIVKDAAMSKAAIIML